MRRNGRQLIITSRHVRHTISTMVQKDPVKALIELITNADDSYARMEENGQEVSGRITVDVIEKRGDEFSLLRVTDEAEGFDPADLELKLGRMGESTSGLEEGLNVRGFFGDGLKEAVLGLGVGGRVSSCRERHLASAELYWNEAREPIFYPPAKPQVATRALREKFQLPRKGNGTVVEVEVAREIRLPRHERLIQELMLHVALRDIVQNEQRHLLLRRLGSNGKELHSDLIKYRDPVADTAFNPVRKRGVVPGYPKAQFDLVLNRAREELSGPEEGMKRIGGLVVQSRRALVDITFFGHENRPGTEYLFGRVTCDYLYDLLRKGEMVVTKYRAGLARENEFVRRLSAEVDRLIDPIIRAEADRLQDSAQANDPQTRKRLDEACRELNQIARDELELTGPGDDSNQAPFRFERRQYRVTLGHERVVRLLASDELLEDAAIAGIEIEGEGLNARPLSVQLDPADARDGLVMAEVTLEGKSLLAEGHILARFEDHIAEASVQIVDPQIPRQPFGFDQETYRPVVGHWSAVTLKIQVPQILKSLGKVAFSTEEEVIQVRPGTAEVDAKEAHGEWLSVPAEVFGDQVGQTDTLIAKLGKHEARAAIVVSTERKPSERRPRGGAIRSIEFNETKENPPQRTLFVDGVIRIFVNEPSIRRYLKKAEDRSLPASRALTAELVLQAFCRYLAPQMAERTLFGFGDEGAGSVDAILRIQDALTKQYGERIHGIINPR